ncbi:hypothetical protein Lal_00002783 [Lupinus albus]|nr:hypothetical protein Lal_00002783 [Lupinus albus]
MNPQILFLFVLLLNLISISLQNPNPKSTPSLAHVELTNYGFPVGLLPATTVLGYAVNQTTGDFTVRLCGACKITLPPDNYVATYSKTIKGKIVKGRMAELDGIRVRAGGPSPESDPPATTSFSNIPPRISMRAPLARAKTLLPEKGTGTYSWPPHWV